MTLRDLQPTFVARDDDTHWHRVDTIVEAHGVQFLCPKCFQVNGGEIGTHLVLCWAPSVPQTASPAPGRWTLVGTSLDDLSLVAGSSSVLLTGGCMAHFYVRAGQIEMIA